MINFQTADLEELLGENFNLQDIELLAKNEGNPIYSEFTCRQQFLSGWELIIQKEPKWANDKPAKSLQFSLFTDQLCEQGVIHQLQVDNYSHEDSEDIYLGGRTYQQLLNRLLLMTPEQLQDEITVHCEGMGEYFKAHMCRAGATNDVLDPEHLYLEIEV